jgi:hypothetical protein
VRGRGRGVLHPSRGTDSKVLQIGQENEEKNEYLKLNKFFSALNEIYIIELNKN